MGLSYVIFSAQYPPHLGGIETFTYNLSHSLIKRGDSVLVVTNDTNDVGTGITDDDGVTVLRLPCHPLVDGRFPLQKHDSKTRGLKKWLEEQKVDGVLVNARFYPHSLAGIKFARMKGLRPVVLDHGSAYLSFSNAALDPVVRLYERTVTEWGKRFTPAYYGISEKSVEWLSELGIEAEGVIPNAIDASAYRCLSSDHDFRSEIGLSDGRLMVAFVGRFIPEKGIRSILEASTSKRLIEAGITFVLAGDGPLAGEVDRSQSESLRWLGRLSTSDVSALLQQSDLLCLPTRSEGYSTTLLEAAACGCPAVVTDVGGARELIPSDSYGTIIRSAGAKDIEEAVIKLLANRDTLIRQKHACRQLVEEKCTWNATSALLEDAFSSAR